MLVKSVVQNKQGNSSCLNLFPFHAPILEPDLDLPLRQAETVRNLDPPPPRQVAIEVELFLQLESLVARVRRPLAFRLTVGVDCV